MRELRKIPPKSRMLADIMVPAVRTMLATVPSEVKKVTVKEGADRRVVAAREKALDATPNVIPTSRGIPVGQKSGSQPKA